MASGQSYKTRALVLRKTRLGEKDLIVTLIAESGALLRAVAKGARKPGGSYSARLELFSVVDLMATRGRNLDIVTDARLVAPSKPVPATVEQTACASAVAELLCAVCQEGLEQPRLYLMSAAALDALADAPAERLLAITVAALAKIVSSAGFRPQLDTCPTCGQPIAIGEAGQRVLFSVLDGGAICADCAPHAEGFLAESETLAWTRTLLMARFSEMTQMDMPAPSACAALQLLKCWIEFHVGCPMKALAFVMACGLF